MTTQQKTIISEMEKEARSERETIAAQAARIAELEAVLNAILDKQDDESMFQLPGNCDEVLNARRIMNRMQS